MGPFFQQYAADLNGCVTDIDTDLLSQASRVIWDCHKRGGQTLIFGNGGSAAMASHVSVDFVKAAGIRASNFNEADLITCFANDFGYENWVAKCIEFHAQSADAVILISSSGNSQNMLNGAAAANEKGIPVVTLSGFNLKNPLRSLGGVNLYANSKSYNHVEMTHHIWLLAIVDYLIMEQK